MKKEIRIWTTVATLSLLAVILFTCLWAGVIETASTALGCIAIGFVIVFSLACARVLAILEREGEEKLKTR